MYVYLQKYIRFMCVCVCVCVCACIKIVENQDSMCVYKECKKSIYIYICVCVCVCVFK